MSKTETLRREKRKIDTHKLKNKEVYKERHHITHVCVRPREGWSTNLK